MHQLNILLVEDEPTTAASVQQALERAGHRITGSARNFTEAVASARRHPPDLAIIDIELGNSSADGLQTARELLSQRWIPIIYLTGHSESTMVQRAMETSPMAYLLKPFRPDQLAIEVEVAYRNFLPNGERLTDPVRADSVLLPHGKAYVRIVKQDVLYIRASGAYTNIYLLNEESPHLASLNLGYLAQYFPAPTFHRISRSLIVNLNQIVRLESNQLWMSTQIVVPIPEGSRVDLVKKLPIIRTR